MKVYVLLLAIDLGDQIVSCHSTARKANDALAANMVEFETLHGRACNDFRVVSLTLDEYVSYRVS
jgi:hypothetical protein